jgi:hypothetical protein
MGKWPKWHHPVEKLFFIPHEIECKHTCANIIAKMGDSLDTANNIDYIDYIRIVNQIMGIIYEKPFYTLLENKYLSELDGIENKSELTNRKNLTKINLQNYFTLNYEGKQESLTDYVCSILRTWVPLSREIPSEEYHNIIAELYEFIDDKDKIMQNQRLQRIHMLRTVD